MLKTFVEEAAALASVVLFVGMIAIWAQVIPQLYVPDPRTGEKDDDPVCLCLGHGLLGGWIPPSAVLSRSVSVAANGTGQSLPKIAGCHVERRITEIGR